MAASKGRKIRSFESWLCRLRLRLRLFISQSQLILNLLTLNQLILNLPILNPPLSQGVRLRLPRIARPLVLAQRSRPALPDRRCCRMFWSLRAALWWAIDCG